MRGKGLVATRIKLVSNLFDEIPERGHRLYQVQKGPNEHEKATVRNVVQLRIRRRQPSFGDVAMEVSGRGLLQSHHQPRSAREVSQ